MKPVFQLGITRKFLLFFILTAILPIILISVLFFNTVDQKLNDRIAAHLHYGIYVAQELYDQDIHRLELLSNEAAFLSVNEKYQHYLNTGESAPLERLLNRYQQSKGLDIVTLLNAKGKVIASTDNLVDLEPLSYQAMIRKALRGKTANSTESFRDPDSGQIHLTYLTVSPVFSVSASQHAIGALLTGQNIGKRTSLQRLSKIITGLESRIFLLQPSSQTHLVYSSLADLDDGTLAEDMPNLSAVLMDKASIQKTFKDVMDDMAYMSYASRITNFLGTPIGYIVVSNSKADIQELFHRDFIYLGLYLLLGLAVISLAGRWFKHSFVDPIVTLSEASQHVAAGNLGIRIQSLSPQKELQETVTNFNSMLDELQESEQLRHNFVSTLTHDLRTPLVAQKRALELFETHKQELNPKLASFAEGLLKSNDNLLDMVNTLLETYQYEAGRIRLNAEWVRLPILVEDCFVALDPIANARNIELSHTIPADFPAIWADPYQLKRVLVNLLGNALENISDGKRIGVKASNEAEAIKIYVHDNGEGIDAAMLPNLFERYAGHPGKRQKIGSGLGLYICKMILTLHGGTIQVDSSPETGTCFTLTLPLFTPPALGVTGYDNPD